MLSLMLLGSAVIAQKKISIAFYLGPQTKSVSGDYFAGDTGTVKVAAGKQFDLGFQTGFMVGYALMDSTGKDSLEVAIGFIQSSQGQSYDKYEKVGTNETFSVSHNTVLNYLRIPVQLIYTRNAAKHFSFTCFAGVYFAPLIGYEDKTRTSRVNASVSTLETSTASGSEVVVASSQDVNFHNTYVHSFNKQTYPLSDKPYKSDFGVTLGAGMQIKLSEKMYLPCMFNYEIGLTDIKNYSATVQLPGGTVSYWGDAADPNSSEKFHTSSLGILIGLKYILK